MAPWLTEYALHHLQPPMDGGHGGVASPSVAASISSSSGSSPRLIQIVGRGGDWWTNAVEGNMRNCWLLVSDGDYCIRAVLTKEAMQEILRQTSFVGTTTSAAAAAATPQFYNFTRGNCALIRNYDLKIVPGNGTTCTSLHLVVGSIEAKPGFQLVVGQQHWRRRRYNNHHHVVEPVQENIHVRFAVRAWNAQQQERERRHQETTAMGAAVANGNGERRPSKRPRTTPLGDVVATMERHPNAYQEMLALAEQDLPEQREEENGNDSEGEEERPQTQDPYQPDTQPPSQIYDPQQDERQQGTPESSNSRMYIQNVLLSEDEHPQSQESARSPQPQSQESVQTPSGQSQESSARTPQPRQHQPQESARTASQQSQESVQAPPTLQKNYASTWDFVKEQLADVRNRVIICQRNGRTKYNPLFSPPPTTGDYLKRHGVARWLQHNVKK
jgi:hypothetical protein